MDTKETCVNKALNTKPVISMGLMFTVLFLCRSAALAACVVSSGPAACVGVAGGVQGAGAVDDG